MSEDLYSSKKTTYSSIKDAFVGLMALSYHWVS